MVPVLACSFEGRWRSLVAHLHDTQGVTGSSPVRPTIDSLREFERSNLRVRRGCSAKCSVSYGTAMTCTEMSLQWGRHRTAQ